MGVDFVGVDLVGMNLRNLPLPEKCTNPEQN